MQSKPFIVMQLACTVLCQVSISLIDELVGTLVLQYGILQRLSGGRSVPYRYLIILRDGIHEFGHRKASVRNGQPLLHHDRL